MSLLGRLRATLAGAKSYSPPPRPVQPVKTGDTETLDCAILAAGALRKVVGESHRQEAIEAAFANATPEPPYDLQDFALEVYQNEPDLRWISVILMRQPWNAYDENAIAVLGRYGMIGYLSRDDAVEYQPVLQTLEAGGLDGGACSAFGRKAENGMIGVVLALSTPEHCMEALEDQMGDDE